MTASQLKDDERIAIEHDCERLVRRYALLVDEGDYDQLADLFAQDAAFARPTDPENPIIGRDALMEGFRKRPGGRVTRHIVANCVIEVDAADRAHGLSYLLLYQGPGEAPSDLTPAGPDGIPSTDKPLMIGQFADRFVREEGRWKFLSRQGSLALKTG